MAGLPRLLSDLGPVGPVNFGANNDGGHWDRPQNPKDVGFEPTKRPSSQGEKAFPQVLWHIKLPQAVDANIAFEQRICLHFHRDSQRSHSGATNSKSLCRGLR